jgi:dTMP kinase
MTRGKLIVLDGGDGSGKTVQTDLLIARFAKEGLPARTVSFPRYETPTGAIVKSYLNGAFGPPMEIGAEAASVLYATDRWAAFREGAFAPLEGGVSMVANRYAASNMAHQGSKIVDPAARTAFFRWNDALEHGTFGIPRPDLNVILHVPAEVSIDLIDGRGNAKDGHENVEHLRRAEATYLELARSFPGFVLIECVKDGALLPREEIHELVWTEVRKILAA